MPPEIAQAVRRGTLLSKTEENERDSEEMNEKRLAEKTKMVFPEQTCRSSAITKGSAAPF